jgi:hypothetical protein
MFYYKQFTARLKSALTLFAAQKEILPQFANPLFLPASKTRGLNPPHPTG